MPSALKGGEWDDEVCSSAPSGHAEVGPEKLLQVSTERKCDQCVTERDGELGGFWCAASVHLLPTVENIAHQQVQSRWLQG